MVKTMNDILQQIQADLLNQHASLSNTLRKAKVLASQLHSQELGAWVQFELDGYRSDRELPDYRVIRTRSVGTWTNGHWSVSNRGVPLYKISDARLREALTTLHVSDGIRTVEQLATRQEQHSFAPEIVALVNDYVSEDDYGFMEIQLVVPSFEYEQILDIVRNRLLDFVLKLDETWHLDDKHPSRDEVKGLVSVTIYNSPQGGNVSTFDQRGQQVTYQYNAAGNINIAAIRDKTELADELAKFAGEIQRAREAKAIDQEVAVEAEYHVLQASKEAKKKEPGKASILEHMGKAKALLEDVAEAAGLVTALVKAAEVASSIFH
jgi:YD repeat-containing protein